MRESVENLVIGGGPAGSMVALRLATEGRDVILLERERGPHHKVCGEFLSPEAVGYLRRAGIEPLDLGARVIQRFRLHCGRRTTETRLPFSALSLSRQILDEALLKLAISAGCNVRRGEMVQTLKPMEKGWSAQLRSGQTVMAKTVFLATGKHDLSQWPRKPGSQSDLVGFKMHWRLDDAQTAALFDLMELYLFRDGYGGLSLVENEIANFCFVVRCGQLRERGGWSGLLNAIRQEIPAIDERMRSGTACWAKPLAISGIPYGHLGGPAKGLWRVGDQAAVIPSFTGDGVSIALHSAELAAEIYLGNGEPEDYIRCLENDLRPAMRFATALSLAMVTAPGRHIAPAAIALTPRVIGWIANRTRIPHRAIRGLDTRSESKLDPSPASAG